MGTDQSDRSEERNTRVSNPKEGWGRTKSASSGSGFQAFQIHEGGMGTIGRHFFSYSTQMFQIHEGGMGTPARAVRLAHHPEVSNPLGRDGDWLNCATEKSNYGISNPLGWDGDISAILPVVAVISVSNPLGRDGDA